MPDKQWDNTANLALLQEIFRNAELSLVSINVRDLPGFLQSFLRPGEFETLHLRFQCRMQLAVIGKQLGLSREEVRRLIVRALHKLRTRAIYHVEFRRCVIGWETCFAVGTPGFWMPGHGSPVLMRALREQLDADKKEREELVRR